MSITNALAGDLIAAFGTSMQDQNGRLVANQDLARNASHVARNRAPDQAANEQEATQASSATLAWRLPKAGRPGATRNLRGELPPPALSGSGTGGRRLTLAIGLSAVPPNSHQRSLPSSVPRGLAPSLVPQAFTACPPGEPPCQGQRSLSSRKCWSSASSGECSHSSASRRAGQSASRNDSSGVSSVTSICAFCNRPE